MRTTQKSGKLFAITFMAAAFLVLGSGIVVVTRLATTHATPGSPGVPEAPISIYKEDFQNTPSYLPVSLTNYVGTSGMTYTAAVPWLTACNGEIIAFNTPDTDFSSSNCSVGDGGPNSGTNLTKAFDQVRRLAYALGQRDGQAGNSGANKALTAYTDYGNVYADPGAGLVQFATATNINLTQNTRRFIISGLDEAAVNCNVNGTQEGQLVLYLLDNGVSRRINQTPINVCDDQSAQTFIPPTLNSNGALGPSNDTVHAGTYLTDKAILTDTSTVGLRMINEQGSGQGNDNAVDNIELMDASPKLDKAFSPVRLDVGGVSRMTFTVTNTTDLLAKHGWSFKDTLPSNLLVAEDPQPSSDCPNFTIGSLNDRTVVQYSGDLTAGMTSCTLSINVTSRVAGTYVNGAANLNDVVGLQLPADATVVYVPKVPNTGFLRLRANALVPMVSAVLTGAVLLIIRRRLAQNTK